MDRLEDRTHLADVRARGDPEAADQAGAEVGHDVAVEVRQDHDVVQLGLLDELHAHVVDDPVLELDPALVVRRDRPAGLEEQAVRELHDVGLVDGRDLVAAVRDGVLEREPGDPLGRGPGDDLDALRRIRPDHVLDPGVEVLGVLPDDDQIDVVVAGFDALHRPGRPEVGVEAERLAERDVDTPEAGSDRRGDRTLDRHAIAADRLEDVVREGRPVGRDAGLAGLHDLPLEGDPRGIEDAPCRLRQLRPDAVAGDEGHSMGHAAILRLDPATIRNP